MTTQTSDKPRNKSSVTAHPLFPAVVALWFGALFGLGSLAVRPSLIESLVLSMHLDVLIPAAAPPLGLLARIIVSLLMAALGIAIGAVIARRIARPKPLLRERQRGAGAIFGARVPREETPAALDHSLAYAPATDLEEAPSGRRRALALTDEGTADFRFDAAPLPGGAPQILDVTQIELTMPAAVQEDEAAAETSLDPVDSDSGQQPLLVSEDESPLQVVGVASDAAPDAIEHAAAPAPFSAPSGLPAGTAAARIAQADLTELSPLELIERLALAMQQRRHSGPVPAVFVEAAAALGAPFVLDSAEPAVVAEELPRFPLPEASESKVEPEPFRLELPAALRPIDFSEYEDVAAVDELPLPPRSFGESLPFANPRIERGDVSSDPAEIELAGIEQAGIEQAGIEQSGIEDEIEEDAYSSLLDLGRPATGRQPFARIEVPETDDDAIEPVVIFPGQQARAGTRFAQPTAVPSEDLPTQAPAISTTGAPQSRRFDGPSVIASAPSAQAPAPANVDAGETERALRSALATLQRMSGAG